MTLGDVNELIGMGKESAMGFKLDGCLLQKVLRKQKKLMESNHKAKVNEVRHQMENIKA
ncbi:hypothetical protein AAVH_43319, partial [Aphelenchoides avenae]